MSGVDAIHQKKHQLRTPYARIKHLVGSIATVPTTQPVLISILITNKFAFIIIIIIANIDVMHNG
jgi:hypothetical protein